MNLQIAPCRFNVAYIPKTNKQSLETNAVYYYNKVLSYLKQSFKKRSLKLQHYESRSLEAPANLLSA